MKKLLRNLGASTALASSYATVAFAEAVNVRKPKLDSPTKNADLGDLLVTVINALLLFAGAVAVLFLIIGGFRYIISAGSEQQVEAAKKTILYAILGLIIIFIAFVLVKLIQQYLGVQGRFIV